MDNIKTIMGRFYNLIRDYQEGCPHTRYKSWEWCHKAFLDNREKYKNAKNENDKDKIIDYLSLHLAFYLASWGMYRGSSYLLDRDYKTHKKAVSYILEEKYKLLWDYNPSENNLDEANSLIFDENTGIYFRVKNSYKGYAENKDVASDTLVTKILMGTFGCVPAFDRFLKVGIMEYKRVYGSNIGKYKLTQQIEKGDTFFALAQLIINNRKDFQIYNTFIDYPPMKCVDMYLWEIGYELELSKGSSNGRYNKI